MIHSASWPWLRTFDMNICCSLSSSFWPVRSNLLLHWRHLQWQHHLPPSPPPWCTPPPPWSSWRPSSPSPLPVLLFPPGERVTATELLCFAGRWHLLGVEGKIFLCSRENIFWEKSIYFCNLYVDVPVYFQTCLHIDLSKWNNFWQSSSSGDVTCLRGPCKAFRP